MKKIIKVEGMKCPHCQKSVETALSALENVKDVKTDLDKQTATVKLSGELSDEAVTKAVTDAGFKVIEVVTKKTLF